MADTGLRLGTPAGRWVVFGTVLGSSLAMLDGTVVNVALAHIGEELDAGFSGLQWTVNAYTLGLAALILLGGSLGDRFGRRRVFVIGVVWFAVASALCAFAPTIETLVAARALQGVGGALLAPGSLAIISASFHGTDRAAAVGAWSGLGGIAGAVGPFLGGWLVEWTWRAVFLINLPLAVLVVWVALRHVPESRDPAAAPGLDLTGTVAAVVGLGGLTWGLTEGRWPVTLVGVLALVVFVLVERRSRHPLVPPTLFASRVFTAANVVTLLLYAALGTLFLLLVLQLQVVAGFPPVLAGAALLPVTVLMLLFSARSGALAQRIGPRLPMTVGPLVAAVGVLLLLRIGPGASWLLDVLPGVLVFAVGLTLTVAPLTATVLDAAPDRYAGAASGVNNAVARSAGLLAVAVIPGLAGIAGADYTDPAAFAAGFRTALLITAGLLAAAGVLAALTVRTAVGDPDRIPLETCAHCGVSSPQSYPR
ncbi:MFS transporter [Pseudonocardia oroxyli]|uniref:Drug resistance transporter, EmrB/QacA subfamily n=1 Tax=Pseudonocardia oroxyli TaxID=366584 RepID=A0A1G7HMR7_PSEOR|nr:MFS transporter [Pseudonocardia oroxyli]SDF01708.1 drug resistance transporter, EmrB/QacA subfamily [Pseudonocardia oroxyli]